MIFLVALIVTLGCMLAFLEAVRTEWDQGFLALYRKFYYDLATIDGDYTVWHTGESYVSVASAKHYGMAQIKEAMASFKPKPNFQPVRESWSLDPEIIRYGPILTPSGRSWAIVQNLRTGKRRATDWWKHQPDWIVTEQEYPAQRFIVGAPLPLLRRPTAFSVRDFC